MGTLFVVATPIGNLEDITIRAIKTLLTVDAIACEDTRRSGLLLKSIRNMYHKLVYDTQLPIKAIQEQPLISYYEQNEKQRIPEIVTALKNGLNIALISDAGTPTISDPGFKLVRECVAESIRVESVPGPTSAISALVSSGLPTDKFLFLGYPPRKPGHRIKFLENVKKSQKHIKSTCIIFEAPHKIATTLSELRSVFGNIEVCICRELTKVHEEVKRISLDDAAAYYTKNNAKGEFVLLFNLAS